MRPCVQPSDKKNTTDRTCEDTSQHGNHATVGLCLCENDESTLLPHEGKSEACRGSLFSLFFSSSQLVEEVACERGSIKIGLCR